MKITQETLDTVIAHHAVLLNRPAWLDPDRRELQRTVWRNLVDLHGPGPGVLRVEDFTEAINSLAVGPDRQPTSVLPGGIVEIACDVARRRTRQAQTRVAQSADLVIYTETTRFAVNLNRVQSGRYETVKERRNAHKAVVAGFRNDVAAVRMVLIDSGLDEHTIARHLTAIDTHEAAALVAAEESRSPLGTAEEHAALEVSIDDATAIVRAMQTGL